MWPRIDNSSRNATSVLDQHGHQNFYVGQPSGADFITHKLTDARLASDSTIANIGTCGERLITNIDVHAVTTSSQGASQVP